MPALRFSHVGIFAVDPHSLAAFYEDVLAFTRTDSGELPGPDGKLVKLVFLSRDPEEHHQIVMVSGRPADLGFNTVNQISLIADSLAELKKIHVTLKGRKDVAELRTVTHGNAVSIYFRDPEGNRIELFVNSDFYCIQPQRVDINLEQPEDQIWAAVEAHARTQAKFRSRSEWVEEMKALMAAKDSGKPVTQAATVSYRPDYIVRFVEASTGEELYGEPVDYAPGQEITRAQVLSGDPLKGEPFSKAGRVARVDRLLAPVSPPDILCIGLNYLRHYEEGAKKRGVPLPEKPCIFMKSKSTLNGHLGEIWRPSVEHGETLDYEAELCIIIAKRCRNVTPEESLDYVLGYTCGNDVSGRHWQRALGQWTKGKSFDTFCPIGPVIAAAAAVGDPNKLGIKCRLNGKTMQDSNTSDMIFRCEEIVSWASRDATLLPGTVIMTGTAEGIGAARDPPVYMAPGDTVEVEIEKIGVLRNTVVQAPS